MGSNGRLDNKFADIDTSGGPGFLGSKIDTINIGSPAQTGEDLKCLRDLGASDPMVDRFRIIAQKDELSESLCAWILDDPEFLKWRDTNDIRLLWIYGDPGKGKTMAMMALLEHVKKDITDDQALGSFFCQNAEPKQNNACSVLRGLIYQLASTNKKLLKILKQKHAAASGSVFDGPGALFDLLDVLVKMLRSEDIIRVYLLIDALDECSFQQEELLQAITRADLASSSKVKWLVTSRYEYPVRRQLEHARFSSHISLESNAIRVTQSVSRFIHDKVQALASVGRYPPDIQTKLTQSLEERAEGTFLWVWLVCKELEKLPFRRALKTVEKYPPTLNAVYRRMIETIKNEHGEDADFCLKILRALAIAPRPLLLPELRFVADLPDDEFCYDQAVEDQVRFCASFLSIRSGRVSFVHQSARDFVCNQENNPVFEKSLSLTHLAVTARSFVRMNEMLRTNICDLPHPGTSNAVIEDEAKLQKLPVDLRYVCLFWVHHFEASGGIEKTANSQDDLELSSNVACFVATHLLHWLEVFLVYGVEEIDKKLIKVIEKGRHKNMVSDLKRFILKFRHGIETSPLQIYYSAITFAPADSLLKTQYSSNESNLISHVEPLEQTWGNNLIAIEGQGRITSAVTFSPDGQLFACGYNDQTIKVWDIRTASLKHLLSGHLNAVTCVAFSYDNTKIVSGSLDRTIRLWDLHSSHTIIICERQEMAICNVAFNRDCSMVLATIYDGSFRMFNVATGQQHAVLELDRGVTPYLHMSPDLTLATVRGFYGPLKIWASKTGTLIQTIEDYSPGLTTIGFSSDNTRLAIASDTETLSIWDLKTGKFTTKWILQVNSGAPSVSFSPHLDSVAYGTRNMSIKLRELGSIDTNEFQGHSVPTKAIVFSSDATMLASSAADGIIKIWDVSSQLMTNTPKNSSKIYKAIRVSPDWSYLFCLIGTEATTEHSHASEHASKDTFTIKRLSHGLSWSIPIESSECRQAFKSLAILPNSHQFAIALTVQRKGLVQVWSIEDVTVKFQIEEDGLFCRCMAFSTDGTTLVSGWGTRLNSAVDRACVIFSDASSGSVLYREESSSIDIQAVSFSPKAPAIAAIARGSIVQFWDVHKRNLLGSTDIVPFEIHDIAWSQDGLYLAALRGPNIIYIWATDNMKLRKLVNGQSDLLAHFPGSSWHTTDDEGQQPRIAIDDSGTMVTIGGRETIWLPPNVRPRPGSELRDLWAATKEDLFIINWQGSLLHIRLDLSDPTSLKEGSAKLQEMCSVSGPISGGHF